LPEPESPITRFIVSVPVFLLAITLHEVAHAWVAYRCGDDTAKLSGRLSLSPLVHLDPVGSLVFIVSSIAAGVGFGWAKPVPVNPLRFRHWRRDDILVSLAGVTANLLQAIAWSALLRVSEAFLTGSIGQAAAMLCVIGVVLNVVLMMFNLLPIPPLDGSHIAFNLLGIRDPIAVAQWSRIGMILLILLVWSRLFGVFYNAIVVPIISLFLR
jgi:Zn-dependent protease